MPGDSITTDGVCLTVKRVGKRIYTTELMPETLNKTTFGKRIPTKVNAERSLRLSDRLDGHLVLGHVDTIGEISDVKKRGRSQMITIVFPHRYTRLTAEKSAIAVDGISLTVINVGKIGKQKGWFTTSLVDYTIKHTALGGKTKGDLVNLEFDILAKYIQH